MKDARKPLSSRALILVWLGCFCLIVLMLAISLSTSHAPPLSDAYIPGLILGALGASLVVGTILLVRWLRHWRNVRRSLLGLAVLITLYAIFVAEENWRCQRDWENSKRNLQARGEWLEWADVIPPSVPDDQNVFQAPKIADWFVKRRGGSFQNNLKDGLDRRFAEIKRNGTNSRPIIIAELHISSSPQADAGEPAIQLSDPDANIRLLGIINSAVGPTAIGTRDTIFMTRPPEAIKPAPIHIQSTSTPSAGELRRLFPTNYPAGYAAGTLGRLDVTPTEDPRHFTLSLDLSLPGYCPPEDFLKPDTAVEADLELIRQALKRPYQRMGDDYEHINPLQISIPNFVMMRTLGHTLVDRAKCHLILGDPESALQDLALLHDSLRLLDTRPQLLVSAMIRVALVSIYTGAINDGLRLHVWRDSDLVALKDQLESINLLSPVGTALKTETVTMNRFCELTGPDYARFFWQLSSAIEGSTPKFNLADAIARNAARLAPRGWFYQNQRVYNELHIQAGAFSYDPQKRQVDPVRCRAALNAVSRFFYEVGKHHFRGIYDNYAKNFLAAVAIPNFVRAMVTATHNQSICDQTLVACALERYRLAHGEYPEALAVLSPQFLPDIPNDLIGGQPLKYRRVTSGGFLLYSVGWNEKDDGGQATSELPYQTSFETGDWVWNSARR